MSSGGHWWTPRESEHYNPAIRFSIRDILLLTVIVALATGWALDRWRLARQRADLDHRVRQFVDLELTRAAEMSAFYLRSEKEQKSYRESAAKYESLIREQIAAAQDVELAKRGYLDTLRSQALGRPPSRMLLELTTEPAENDN